MRYAAIYVHSDRAIGSRGEDATNHRAGSLAAKQHKAMHCSIESRGNTVLFAGWLERRGSVDEGGGAYQWVSPWVRAGGGPNRSCRTACC